MGDMLVKRTNGRVDVLVSERFSSLDDQIAHRVSPVLPTANDQGRWEWLMTRRLGVKANSAFAFVIAVTSYSLLVM